MTYYEKEELRSEISLIRELINIQVEGYNPPRKQRLESVAKFKKKIREKLKYYNNREEDERHYTSDGEGYYYKKWFDEPFTEEEKREYIKDSWEHINLPWSPTGQWYTQDILIHNVETSFGAKAVAYIFMSLDV